MQKCKYKKKTTNISHTIHQIDLRLKYRQDLGYHGTQDLL